MERSVLTTILQTKNVGAHAQLIVPGALLAAMMLFLSWRDAKEA